MDEKKEIEESRNILTKKLTEEVDPVRRLERREDLNQFNFIVNNRDMFDWKQFFLHNIDVPSFIQPVFEKHLNILRAHCRSTDRRKPKINQCKEKFGKWRINFETGSGVNSMFYVLVDNMINDIEKKYKDSL